MKKCRSRKRYHSEPPLSLNKFGVDVLHEVKALFNKKFVYRKPVDNAWQLPHVPEMLACDYEEFEELQVLKNSLNDVKNKLSDKDLEKWHQHTSFTNVAGNVIFHVKKSVSAELCTQAWCKFHEIVCTFPILPEDALQNGELNSVHLCEAPGAFIASLNHYLKSHHIHCDWCWVANTLNPYHESNDGMITIVDDRLIASTLPWWYFGPDDTGNIMSPEYLRGLQQFITNMCKVHLVTADGSFNCQGNPGEQEILVSPLHYCETVTALEMLCVGGSFILKVFTLFEHASVNLLYLLNCCFREVHVIKPGTSKAGNSELYVVCIDYAGKDFCHPLLSRMVQSFGTALSTKALFPKCLIPDSFIKQHVDCCRQFSNIQAKTIHENIRLFEYMSDAEKEKLGLLRDCAAEYFVHLLDLQQISWRDRILKKPWLNCGLHRKLLDFQSNKFKGTFNERKELESISWREKVLHGPLKSWAKEHIVSNAGEIFLEGPYDNIELGAWYILKGKTLEEVKASPFCNGELLKKQNEAITESTPLKSSSSVPVLRSCRFCSVLTADSFFARLAQLIQGLHGRVTKNLFSQLRCLLIEKSLLDTVKSLPPSLCVTPLQLLMHYESDWTILHDGDPKYQQYFLKYILRSFQELRLGSSLILPILSSYTRFTAGLILILHCCFQFITFVCPTSLCPFGSSTLLLCLGYRGLPSSCLQFLQELSEEVDSLVDSDPPQQVLQFVPMDTLLKGRLQDFLWSLNTTVTKYRLHQLICAEELHSI